MVGLIFWGMYWTLRLMVYAVVGMVLLTVLLVRGLITLTAATANAVQQRR